MSGRGGKQANQKGRKSSLFLDAMTFSKNPKHATIFFLNTQN